MTEKSLPELLPGDCLLYTGSGPAAWAIKVKTWSDVSHCSGYQGAGRAAASRDGLGVDEYPLRTDGLYAILRPCTPFDPAGARRYLEQTRGQAYDWLGLLRFFTIGKQSDDTQFCSEFLTRWYRAAGVRPFADHYDADLVSPGMFLSAPCFDVIWRAPAAKTTTSFLAAAPARFARWLTRLTRPTDPKE